ncbi:MAG: hypothetical protein JO340_07360 [Acidobacteriaceae bacterium]|nr:hypothetical protein [Acidobacteriaceae bacterium]
MSKPKVLAKLLGVAAALLGVFSIGGCFVPTVYAKGSSGTRTVEINDSALNMNAFTLKIPADWKFVGMILRPHGCYAPMVPADGMSYSAVAPDGVNAVMQLPGAHWAWSSDGTSPEGRQCAPIAIDSATAFLLNIAVPHIHPTARIIGIQPLSAQDQQGLEEARRRQASMDMNNGQLHMRNLADLGKVRIEYVLDGKFVQEQLSTFVTCMVNDQPAFPALHRPARSVATCQAHGIWIRRAPKGGLDRLLEQLAALQPGPPQINRQWDQEVSQRMKAAFAQYQAAQDRQFQSIQQHYRQVTANMIANGQRFNDNLVQTAQHAMAADRAQQAAIDHAAHLQVLDSLNRQDFVDPQTGKKIETSNQYMHNWISTDKSEVVLSNDSTFDPNGVVDPIREGWTELIPVS